ncbi:acyl-CoA dehydrogenase family protein [Blastococcus haudaquaticus]|uniref:Acyl-CoA dehydrogenase n=1 Tax=Blastococcus haudaquaticus TaxID=1938745 RepID=A0A286GU30_9ACTN|nr:acyl-CoA dehydrogenase family protein [Blastococcus haudaquaticus]SOD99031.1 Acyl-CoA dehydrogenase [Blastococcus haudaquaticus]
MSNPQVSVVHDEALARARAVTQTLAADVVEREAAGKAPLREVELLRESGLLPLLLPAEHGGSGAGWPTAWAVVRTITAVDPSIGQLLGYHYLHSWRIRLNRRADAVARLDAAGAAGAWFWGGAGNPRDAGLQLEPVRGGFLLSGTKHFATGAEVADRINASGTRTGTGEKLALAVDAHQDGVRHGGDWDALGQRLSASGSVTFDGAFVSEDDVLGPNEQADPGAPAFATLHVLSFQAMLAQLYVGIAEGALAAGAEYTRTKSRAWATSGVEEAVDDPLVRQRYGQLDARLRAAAALADRAAASLTRAAERGWDLEAQERADVAVELAAAKVVTTEAALEVTSTVFELTGARATKTGTGLDRYWRDARTLTLHDPAAHKAVEVGDRLLSGTAPVPSAYS